MLNLSDESVHFGRRDCSTSAAEGVQLERYIHSAKEYIDNSQIRQDNCKVIAEQVGRKVLRKTVLKQG